MTAIDPDFVIPSTGWSAYAFGDALAASGDELLVGATFRDYAYVDPDNRSVPPPACFLFRCARGSFVHLQTLIPRAGALADGFARALALGPSFGIVGAPGYENGDGPVHDFERQSGGAFQLRALVDSPESHAGANDVLAEYGAAVASDASTLVIGAGLESEWRDGNATVDGGGVVYVFTRASGDAPPIATLRGARANENFGSALALSGDVLIVGAPGAASNERLAGAVLVYRREAPDHFRELCRIEGRYPGEQFGAQIAFDGARLAVSAPGRADLGAPQGSGRVELFELVHDGCRALATISEQPGFGLALALEGDRLAIGDPMHGAPDGPLQCGRVALYRWTRDASPQLEAWLKAPTADAYARLGAALALGRDFVAAGAPGIGNGDGKGFVAIKSF